MGEMNHSLKLMAFPGLGQQKDRDGRAVSQGHGG
jgi:hypothetical protein